MNRIIFFIIIGLFVIVMTSCNKVDKNTIMESTSGNSKINTQGTPVEVKSDNNNVENSNGKNSEKQVGLGYKVEETKYIEGEITIKYPQITNLGDDNRQKKINKILKAEAISVLGFYEGSNDVSLDISYKIPWQSPRIISVQYSGVGNTKDAAYPFNLLYTININVDNGSKLTLKDFIEIDNNFVNSFRNFIVKDPENNQASASAFDYILNTYSVEDLIRYFEGADSSYENSAFTFSYFTKDSIGISIEVPHAVGDHLEVELKYEDIKDNIKTENEIWKDLLHQNL